MADAVKGIMLCQRLMLEPYGLVDAKIAPGYQGAQA
jgi:hypothetical protein